MGFSVAEQAYNLTLAKKDRYWNLVDSSVSYQREALNSLYLQWEGKPLNLPGLRFLDIACGSDNNSEKNPPIFARWLATQGANVVGIDAGSNDPEFNDAYQHIVQFLPVDSSFSLRDFLNNHGVTDLFDIIYSNKAFSPTNPSPSIPGYIEERETFGIKMIDQLQEWAPQVLKPNGYLIILDVRGKGIWRNSRSGLERLGFAPPLRR